MTPNKPKRSFTETAFNVGSEISLVGGRLVKGSQETSIPAVLKKEQSLVNTTKENQNINQESRIYPLDVNYNGQAAILDVYIAGTGPH